MNTFAFSSNQLTPRKHYGARLIKKKKKFPFQNDFNTTSSLESDRYSLNSSVRL